MRRCLNVHFVDNMLRQHIRLSKVYGFERPNDKRGLDLMNAAAHAVMQALPDITISYGVSDEYRYAFSLESGLATRLM